MGKTVTSSFGWDNFFSSTLSSSISASDTVIPMAAVPTSSEGFLVIEPSSSANREIIYYTSKSASDVTCPSVADGRGVGATSALSHSSGVAVKMLTVAEMFEILQNGTALSDDAVKLRSIQSSEELFPYDFIASGCVWSGDSYGSTLNASMTSGVVYIGGIRVPVTAITARAFTASRDTYIDVGVDGVVDYNEQTNNAASPALSADHMRIGIIISGASSIANAGSVNQGQVDKLLPIASSIPYAVTDSLGNLICPRDPNRKVLGFRQSTTLFQTATSGSMVDITGMSVPVIVPTGRRILILLYVKSLDSSHAAGSVIALAIREGSTTLAHAQMQTAVSQYQQHVETRYATHPSAGAHTYKASIQQNGTGTVDIQADSTAPFFIMVELV